MSLIIDGLTHVTAQGKWLDGKSDASCGTLLKQMDLNGVSHAIVTAIQERISDDEVCSACQAHPDRLIGFCAPPINESTDARPSLRKAKDRGFVGVKLHPRFGRFDIASQAVLDVVGCAVELAMPVILCGLSGARGQIASPPPHQVLGSWADAFPEHPFVLAHAGSHRILDAWEMARNRENVYLDLSHTLHYFRGSSIETDIGFVARRLDRRTLFGSDFPECTIGAALEALRGHFRRWPDANQEAILGGTWQTILGISTP